ncbi:hypothetical protein [Loktanella sp. SALINAS62]|uniref:hypothetical protein n=1 Tax=Loktanella sp. SALINAS62 TaxID=2706124 RepID=UPI001B8AB507|nr:hypothetical protein [Loktanella sp. SALINAS62]MBS1303606.1 hypothetical protein [Loktanella sp. SALINAS62]
MTDFSTYRAAPLVPALTGGLRKLRQTGFVIEETYWGYSVVDTGSPRVSLVLTQLLVMCVGAMCAASAVAQLMLSPIEDILFRSPLIAGCFAFALLLMWFATRGLSSRFEVDTNLSELREVIRNRTGRFTIRARHGFDATGSVYIERTGVSTGQLCLRFRNSTGRLLIATGCTADLERVRDRMGRDMIVNNRS